MSTSEPKKKRCRLKDAHRWTEEQTRVLLDHVLNAIKDDPTKYERPTSQKFYKMNCQHNTLDGIDWQTMRAKMRYLKSTYIKAIQWRDQVGSELFQSDKTHVEARMKTICPFYTQLNAIFEPMLPADPIRLTDNDFNKYLPTTKKNPEQDYSMDATEFEDSECDSVQNNIVPKIEHKSDEGFEPDEEPTSPITNRRTAYHQARKNFFNESAGPEHNEETTVCYKSKFQIDSAKLSIERKRLDLDCQYRVDKKTLSRLQLNFEREKLEFEKQKMFEEHRLRKYEIDKQFEARKLEIEKDERIQRLELEYKYQFKGNEASHHHMQQNDYI